MRPTTGDGRVAIGALWGTFEFDRDALRQRGGVLANYARDDFAEGSHGERVHRLTALNHFVQPKEFIPLAEYIASGVVRPPRKQGTREAACRLAWALGMDACARALAPPPLPVPVPDPAAARQHALAAEAREAVLADFGRVYDAHLPLAERWETFCEQVRVPDVLAAARGQTLAAWVAAGDAGSQERTERAANVARVRWMATGRGEDRSLRLGAGYPLLPCLPPQMFWLARITDLTVWGIACAELPPLAAMGALQSLRIRRCPALGWLPDLRELSQLRRLTLEWLDALDALPDSLTALHQLQAVSVAYTPLRDWPRGLGALGSLAELTLESTDLPAHLGELGGLQTICAHRLLRAALPASITALRQLRTLDVSSSRSLTALPADLGALGALQRLDLRGCAELTALPESVAELTQLTELDLRQTQVWSRPSALTRPGLQIHGDPGKFLPHLGRRLMQGSPGGY